MNISDSEEKTRFLKRLFEETYISDIVGRHSALRYDIKGKKYIDTPVKYYFTDLGVVTLNGTNEKGHGIRRQLVMGIYDFLLNENSPDY